MVRELLGRKRSDNPYRLHAIFTITICHGFPQGSILDPLLFTLYFNDLPNIVSNCEIESYVDDTKLFLSFKLWYRPSIVKRLSRSPSGCGMALSSSVTNESRQNKVSSEEWSSQLRTQFMQLRKKPERNSGLQLQTKFILFGTKQELGKLVNPMVSILGKILTPDIRSVKILASILAGQFDFRYSYSFDTLASWLAFFFFV